MFGLDIIYEVELDTTKEEILEDITVLAEGFKLLQYDYIGGSGSRGYGKVAFKNLASKVVVGKVEEDVLQQCNEILQKAVEG